jgi:hypothetical protein
MSVQFFANRSAFSSLNDVFSSFGRPQPVRVQVRVSFAPPYYYSEAPIRQSFTQSHRANHSKAPSFSQAPLRNAFSSADQLLMSLLVTAILTELLHAQAAQAKPSRTRAPSSQQMPGVRPQFRTAYAGNFYNSVPRHNPFEPNWFKPQQRSYAYYQPQSNSYDNFSGFARGNGADYFQQQYEPNFQRANYEQQRPRASQGAEHAGPSFASEAAQKQQEVNTAFAVLGLTANANEQDVKRAYRKLALQNHPDKATGDKEAAKKRFQEISNANDVLKAYFEERR